MEKSVKIGCLVMAAGNSARFGSNKLAMELDGKSLLLRALEAVPKECFSAVAVVTQYEQAEQLAAQFGFAAIHNEHPDWGISHTIFLGTQALQGCDGILYMVADQPRLSRESVARIAETWKEYPDCIVGASCGGVRGNPNLFPRRFFDELLALRGDHGGNVVIRAHEEKLLLVEVGKEELTDCDTPQALEALKGRPPGEGVTAEHRDG